jgi:hypothetical protein
MEAANTSTTTGQRPNEAVIRDSIDFLLHDTGDKVIKSDECLAHLANLELAADHGGVTAAQFSLMVRIVGEKQMPARILQRFLFSLVPSEPVPGDAFAFECGTGIALVVFRTIWFFVDCGVESTAYSTLTCNY